jgi:uncharacterized protein with von Willebrand factor type A (vWA) domain
MTLDAPYDRLAPLPRALWLPALVTSAGRTAQRLTDLERWRTALERGELPAADADFGDAEATTPLRTACGDLGLPTMCRRTPALAEQLLRTLLWHLDRLIDLQPRRTRAEAIAHVSGEFRDAWQREQGAWDTVLALLQDLGDLAHLRWDELRGLLTSREWREAQRIAERLAQLPELVALIHRLGRAERAAHAEALPPQPLDACARRVLGFKIVETRLTGPPGELRGIRHGGRVEGMLGSEAAMLLHPVLHRLWRARFAEARLLTYDSEAVLHDLRPDPAAPPRSDPAPPRPEALERGPLIVCLDTSGSMRGAPENIAKAVALEAMRTAYRERRGCLLIAFGGPGEIIERELGYTRQGLQSLLDLMGQAFDGGTDIQGPIERAIDRVHEARWAGADLLIVSDGEFGCTPATLRRLDSAQERFGLRVQGVLVGDRETMGLMEVADAIHWVRDWRCHADEPEAHMRERLSPVHTRSLTARFFPDALSGRAARHRPT